jgi:hypothetical protein
VEEEEEEEGGGGGEEEEEEEEEEEVNSNVNFHAFLLVGKHPYSVSDHMVSGQGLSTPL